MDPNKKEVLDSLLDSMTLDDTMEKKIDEFSKNKQRRKRIEKARETSAIFTETYSSEARQKAMEEATSMVIGSTGNLRNTKGQKIIHTGDFARGSVSRLEEQTGKTQVIETVSKTPKASDVHAATMVYQKPEENETPPESETVVMNGKQIQNLMAEEEPLLKREYINKDSSTTYEDMPERVSRSSGGFGINWKIPAAIVAGALAVLLLFGGVQIFTSWLSTQASEAQVLRQEAFDKLSAWIDGYSQLSDEDKDKIADLESFYNRLDQEQKDKINSRLSLMTGKSFDELLALAKSADKQNGSNNNTEIAVEKAKLKDQIASVTAQRDGVQAQLDEVQAEIASAYSNYQAENDAFIAATNSYNESVTTYNNAVAAQQNYVKPDYNSQINSMMAEINSLRDQLNRYEDDDEDEDDDGDGGKAQIQARIDELNASVASLQQQQAAETGKEGQLASAVNTALTDMNTRKTQMDSASVRKDEAYAAYQNINGSDADLVNQVNGLNEQIQSLQNQLAQLN